MSYEFPQILNASMLNELAKYKDHKSRNITYWANIMKLLKVIYKLKTKKKSDNREIILDRLEKSFILKKNLRRDIDHLAEIRHAYGHDDSILVMSGKTKKTMISHLEKTYYVKTRSKKSNSFKKYEIDRKVGLLCLAIFSNLSEEYKKLVKPELFDVSKYQTVSNKFEY